MLTAHRLRVCTCTLAEAAICAAFSRSCRPLSCALGLSSLMILTAVMSVRFCVERSSKAIFIKGSTVVGLLKAMSICGCTVSGRAGASSVSKANLRAERSVTSELIRQETKIKSIVPFKTCSLSSRLPSGRCIS